MRRVRPVRPLVAAAVAALLAGCGGAPRADPVPPPAPPSAQLTSPHGVEVAAGATVAQVVAAVSADLFASAPVAVVVAPDDPAALAAAGRAAARLGAPLLLGNPPAASPPAGLPAAASPASPAPGPGPTAAELKRLGARAVLTVGPVDVSVATPAGATVTAASGTDPLAMRAAIARLPRTARPARALTDTTVLVRTGTGAAVDTAAAPLAEATAGAAGAAVVAVASSDPRTDPAAIAALAKRPAGPVVAAGSGFAPVQDLALHLAVARTGVQLPGGGQVMFPGRALVALYGHPGSSSLGVLGDQDAAASVARAQQVAAPYQALYPVPVIPTFEIIAAVASGSAGADGDFTTEFPVGALQPFVDAATRAGMYVVLDIQPGRGSVLEEAERYEQLLLQPNVGLAIDPEWALGPDQQPLQQIGSLDSGVINQVETWLSRLVTEHHLPQKVLVVHQFRLAMIGNERALQPGDDQVALLVHVDGQGSRPDKEATWRAAVAAAPPGVWFGWKNFYEEDTQLASPEATVDRSPRPVMVSYQ